MNDMPMPGGSTMSIAMSMLMMAAMMLPSSALLLRRDRQSAIAGTGYFLVWIAISAFAVPLGDALAQVGPITRGAVLLAAGAFQFSSWKMRALECLGQSSAGAGTPFRRGLQLGLHCARCCANLMVVLLAIGAMDLSAMIVVTIAITLERVALPGRRIAHAIGSVVIIVGVYAIASSISR